MTAVIAVHALEVAKVTERGSTSANADGENVHESLPQVVQLFKVEFSCCCERLKASDKEAFIGIDVANTCHKGLIQKGRLDRSSAALQSLSEVSGGKRLAEWFRPQSAQPRDHRFDRLTWGNPPHLSEAAHVDETKLLLPGIPEARPCVLARFCGFFVPLELAGHAQMHSPAATGLAGAGIQQLGHQVFAASTPLANGLTGKTTAKSCRAPRAGHSTLTEDFGLLNNKRLKTVRQSPTNRFNFRKFRQES